MGREARLSNNALHAVAMKQGVEIGKLRDRIAAQAATIEELGAKLRVEKADWESLLAEWTSLHLSYIGCREHPVRNLWVFIVDRVRGWWGGKAGTLAQNPPDPQGCWVCRCEGAEVRVKELETSLANAHCLLHEAASAVDPETWSDLSQRLFAVLDPCALPLRAVDGCSGARRASARAPEGPSGARSPCAALLAARRSPTPSCLTVVADEAQHMGMVTDTRRRSLSTASLMMPRPSSPLPVTPRRPSFRRPSRHTTTQPVV